MTEGNDDLHAEVRHLREQNEELKTALCRLVFYNNRAWFSQWKEDADLSPIVGDLIKPENVKWDGRTGRSR